MDATAHPTHALAELLDNDRATEGVDDRAQRALADLGPDRLEHLAELAADLLPLDRARALVDRLGFTQATADELLAAAPRGAAA